MFDHHAPALPEQAGCILEIHSYGNFTMIDSYREGLKSILFVVTSLTRVGSFREGECVVLL